MTYREIIFSLNRYKVEAVSVLTSCIFNFRSIVEVLVCFPVFCYHIRLGEIVENNTNQW